jgi:hypothetical protein
MKPISVVERLPELTQFKNNFSEYVLMYDRFRCNTALGMLKDSTEHAQQIVTYLSGTIN